METLIAGRYRPVSRLGRGGYGEVYRAEQLGLERPVALKLLHERQTDAVAFERFSQEARVAQQLSHPNTVRLLDFGIDGERPFMVFELLEGIPLAQLIKREGAQPPARVAHIAVQVLKSLMEAHALGVIHRDIKPANLFLSSHAGEQDFVRVLDFGIAKLAQVGAPVLTRDGEVVGTPAYMSPEHVSGSQLTPAADLYSLGLVMAELLTGAKVYSGEPSAICLEQVSDNPVPLRPMVLESPLGAVIHRAVEKDVHQRYRNAEGMLEDLERAMARSSAAQLEAPTANLLAPRAQSKLKPQRGPWLALGLGVLLLGGVVAVALVAGAMFAVGAFDQVLGNGTSVASTAPKTTDSVERASAASSSTAGALGSGAQRVGSAPRPSPPTTASLAPAAASGKRPTFDLGKATAAAQKRAAVASSVCKSHAGVESYSVTLRFHSTGAVSSLQVNPSKQDPRGSCVFQTMSSTTAPAFDGEGKAVSTSVNF